jgi:hypothetical protein
LSGCSRERDRHYHNNVQNRHHVIAKTNTHDAYQHIANSGDHYVMRTIWPKIQPTMIQE